MPDKCPNCNEQLILLIRIYPRSRKIKNLINYLAGSVKLYYLTKLTPRPDYERLEQLKHDFFGLIEYCSKCHVISVKGSDFAYKISTMEEINDLIRSKVVNSVFPGINHSNE